MTITVVIVEDHEVVAEALATMLSFDTDIEVLGFVACAADALTLVRERHPDIVLMDIALAGDVDGTEATRQILAAEPSTAVIVLSMHDDPDSVTAAVAAGAIGYVPKNTGRAELLTAIRTAASGEGYLHPSITRPLLDRIGPVMGNLGAGERLTPQEHRVLQGLADGKGTRSIAALLSISDETVKTHLTRIYQKLGVSDRTQAVATALRRHIVS